MLCWAGTVIAHQGLREPLTEAPAASPTALSLSVTFKPALPATETSLVQALQKHPLYFE